MLRDVLFVIDYANKISRLGHHFTAFIRAIRGVGRGRLVDECDSHVYFAK